MKRMKSSVTGQPSNSTTMAIVAFILVCISYAAGMVSNLTIGDFSISFAYPEASLVGVFLAPLFGLYGWRRHEEEGASILEAFTEGERDE